MNSGSVQAGETQHAPHCVQAISGSSAYNDCISAIMFIGFYSIARKFPDCKDYRYRASSTFPISTPV